MFSVLKWLCCTGYHHFGPYLFPRGSLFPAVLTSMLGPRLPALLVPQSGVSWFLLIQSMLFLLRLLFNIIFSYSSFQLQSPQPQCLLLTPPQCSGLLNHPWLCPKRALQSSTTLPHSISTFPLKAQHCLANISSLTDLIRCTFFWPLLSCSFLKVFMLSELPLPFPLKPDQMIS